MFKVGDIVTTKAAYTNASLVLNNKYKVVSICQKENDPDRSMVYVQINENKILGFFALRFTLCNPTNYKGVMIGGNI